MSPDMQRLCCSVMFLVHRVVAGQWLGPWVLCKALAAAAAKATSDSLQQQRGLGLSVHVACDPGGGAPELDPVQLQQLLPSSDSSGAAAAAAASLQERQGQQPGTQQPQQGLLLLVPLTLGVGKVRWVGCLSAVAGNPMLDLG